MQKSEMEMLEKMDFAGIDLVGLAGSAIQ